MFTKQFWKAAVERAVKTAAQSAIAIIAAAQFNWLTADWSQIGTVVLTATVLSILTSIASEGMGPKNSPSLVD